ncbi:MAG: DUF2007 domain-containing protein [Flavobacteriales bacterium]|nr:DUF2007 domain-containing protein [Flavobacteriales bacterium]
MDNNWSQVYETSLLHKAEIVKAVLYDKEIEAVILNGQSSTHLSINMGNDIQVYVKNTDIIEAKYIISKREL